MNLGMCWSGKKTQRQNKLHPPPPSQNTREMKHRCQKRNQTIFFSWNRLKLIRYLFLSLGSLYFQQWNAPAFWWGPSSWLESTSQMGKHFGARQGLPIKMSSGLLCVFISEVRTNEQQINHFWDTANEAMNLYIWRNCSVFVSSSCLSHSKRMTRSIIHSLSKHRVCFSKDILYCHVGIQDIVRHVPQFLLT